MHGSAKQHIYFVFIYILGNTIRQKRPQRSIFEMGCNRRAASMNEFRSDECIVVLPMNAKGVSLLEARLNE